MALRFPAFGTGFNLALSSQAAMAISDDGKWLFSPTSGTTPFGGLGKLNSSAGYTQVTGLTQPTITANSRQLPAFSPDSKKVAISGHAVADGMPVYSIASNGQVTHDTVDVAPTIISRSVAFHPNGNFVVIGWTTTTTTVFTVYKKISDTAWQWVADYGTSVSVGTATISTVFNDDGTMLAICGTTTPFIRVFDFDGTTGTATEISSVFTVTPLSGISQIVFNPANNDLIASVSAAPRARYWQWNSGTRKYTLQTYSGSFAGTTGGSLSVDEKGNHLMVVGNASPIIQHFDISGRNLVDATNPDQTTIGSASGRVAFSKKGAYLVYEVGVSPNNFLCDVRSASEMTASGFLPTASAALGNPVNIHIAASGFLPTSVFAATIKYHATIPASGFLPTAAIVAKVTDKAAMPVSGYLPTSVATVSVKYNVTTGNAKTQKFTTSFTMKETWKATSVSVTHGFTVVATGQIIDPASSVGVTKAFIASGVISVSASATGVLLTPKFIAAAEASFGNVATAVLVTPAFTADGTGSVTLAASGATSTRGFSATGLVNVPLEVRVDGMMAKFWADAHLLVIQGVDIDSELVTPAFAAAAMAKPRNRRRVIRVY